MSKKSEKSDDRILVTFTPTPEQLARLDKEKELRGVSRKRLIKRAIRKFLKEE